jgi:transcriptional regulator with XRE-family HTH domain
MEQGKITKLKRWRLLRGITVRDAGKLIVVDGKPASPAAWSDWENGKKIPSREHMLELERVTGIEPNDYYARPDGAEPLQHAA